MVPHHGESRADALPRAGDLARVVRAPNGRRYRIEACNSHRPTQIEDRGAVA
jgi:hypothetical protein